MSVTVPKALPQANGDFYAISSTLSEEDQALLRPVRDFLEEVAPIINQYWTRAEPQDRGRFFTHFPEHCRD